MKAIPYEGKVSKNFLFYFLKNLDILNYIINSSSRAAGQSGLNKATIEPYPFSYPSLEEQSNIVQLLDRLNEDIQRLETIYQEKLSNLDEVKKSLLKKAFAGELTADAEATIKEEAIA
jgi:type I restriction enzyme S subunit